VILAAVAAFAAAFSFAMGSALQQRVAGSTTPDEESHGSFFVRIARHPSWLVGLGLSALAFALHAFALSRGDLALVQPIIVSGIVFAVVIRSALEHRFPATRTLVWLVITWAGLALFLAVRPPTADQAPRNGLGAVLVVVGVVVALLGMAVASRTRTPQLRGAVLAGVAGLLFGLVAGLVKLVLARFADGFVAVLGSWSLWALVVTGLWAVLLNQRAYQATRLSVTTPILNVVEVAVAILFGLLVLGEDPGQSPAIVVGELAGLALVIAGVIKLASADGPAAEAEPAPAAEVEARVD
jgi:drug/metabolite transporter (DMT)-like permease